MKHLLFLLTTLSFYFSFAQNIKVDSHSYTPQQLIEDILINNGCIKNVVVKNVVGGNFNNTDQSYGYFDATGTTFPIQSGIVLSTGRLQHVKGPNNSLSDDNAANWSGDNDLENILNESNTTNATILEFEFSAIADQISFRYIFASEEYQEGNSTTCKYSDLFGFLIKPIGGQYTNIALIPNTQTPVKVTTVHPEIPGGCSAQNEAYFGSWNNSSAPINFNGQTKVLTATTSVIPNKTYRVKLVIADEQNYRYDSAVFLEAGSFVANTNLGPNRLISTNNPICDGDKLKLNAYNPNSTGYTWYKDGIQETTTGYEYEVTKSGVYSVEVQIGTNCTSYGEVTIEYINSPTVQNTTLTECDSNNDGLAIFNLRDAEQAIFGQDQTLYISNYFLSNGNVISDSEISNFKNTIQNQIVYARVLNQYGCSSIAEIILQAVYSPYNFQPFTTCDNPPVDGYTIFNLNDLKTQLEPIFPTGANIAFYKNEENALSETNALTGNFENTDINIQTIFVKVKQNGQCITLSSIDLEVLETPILENDITENNPIYYCLNTFPKTIPLNVGTITDSTGNIQYLWNTGETTAQIQINEPGLYQVTVTNANGCSNIRNITVVPSNIASIENIEVVDASENNTLTILVSGEGDYEYALDGGTGPYQDSNFFENVTSGFHTVFVRDRNKCGITSKEISVIGFPKFFTPNNDGYNDTWQVQGIINQFQPNTVIHIFDRYGKLLAQINPLGAGWNGYFKNKLMPNDDYWFAVELQDGRIFKSHFALKR